jgi:hypothetical protein
MSNGANNSVDLAGAPMGGPDRGGPGPGPASTAAAGTCRALARCVCVRCEWQAASWRVAVYSTGAGAAGSHVDGGGAYGAVVPCRSSAHVRTVRDIPACGQAAVVYTANHIANHRLCKS